MGNPKAEIRRPKETRNPKAETRTLALRRQVFRISGFGLRISLAAPKSDKGGLEFRPSDFGFLIKSGLRMGNKAVIAIGAHPDDIEFYMAGTLLLLKQAG